MHTLGRAVLDTYHDDYEAALGHISKAQSEVYNELQERTAYLDFSASNYATALSTLSKAQVRRNTRCSMLRLIVCAQMLVELEEVIRCK